LDDNPALAAAVARGKPIVPVFIWDPIAEGEWRPGGASRCWLHGSIQSLAAGLQAAGSRLVIRTGGTLGALSQLIEEVSADAVFWNRRYEPDIVKRDGTIKSALHDRGLIAESFNSHLLFEPMSVRTKQGTPYKVFTPFYRACLAREEPAPPLASPKQIKAPGKWPATTQLDDLGLLPRIPWDAGIQEHWRFGKDAARARLDDFVRQAAAKYPDNRDRPDLQGTSALSPYLHFGELSPRRAWHSLKEAMANQPSKTFRQAGEGYLRQLVWREFAYHLLFHFPHTAASPLKEKFERFPWRDDPRALRAWQQGKTGYPIIDAGMRQLWTTGWMHNRVRMLVGSFLVKDLLIPWQHGAKWFWDTLVDADLANNTLGWQWVAGCGADAAPFFRIFNPVSQGERFDPNGDYVRQWVPELARLPERWIHQPWKAPQTILHEAGVKLGRSYPAPIVDHDAARKRALELFREMGEG